MPLCSCHELTYGLWYTWTAGLGRKLLVRLRFVVQILGTLVPPFCSLPIDLAKHQIHGSDNSDGIGQQMSPRDMVETT